MPVDLIWATQARRDLIEIYAYIGQENPSAAERLWDSIEARAELLRFYPRLGNRRPDIRASTRMLIEGHYLILYQTLPDTDEGPIHVVQLVRIIDGRRNLHGIL